MEYEIRTYFAEHEESQVKGFTIIDAEDGSYNIAEKWNKEDGGSQWLSYTIPEDRLLARVEQELCEPKAKLTDEQFVQVCEHIASKVNNGVIKEQKELA